MELPTHELQAFRMVAETLSFSAAAERVHITQPALSQRIQSLERLLGLTLFVRDRKAIRLTEAGLRLLRYCQAKDHLECELLADLVVAPDGKLAGHLRIAGYSSVVHMVLMPALAELLRDNPKIQFEFSVHEMDALDQVLESGAADFVVMDHTRERANIETAVLGQEKYVLVQSNQFPARKAYLDFDPQDRITEVFLKFQGQEKPDFERSYIGDMSGLLQGVALGLGLGVIPRHMLPRDFPARQVKGVKTMNVPVVLHYFKQSYYSRLQKTVIETLKRNCQACLR